MENVPLMRHAHSNVEFFDWKQAFSVPKLRYLLGNSFRITLCHILSGHLQLQLQLTHMTRTKTISVSCSWQ